MFKTFNKRVILELHNRVNNELEIGGKKFVLDTAFRPLWNAVQFGNVISAGEGSDLQPGDRVYVHHFVMEREHIIPVDGHKLSWVEYGQCYARVRDNEIKALGEYVLVEPMKYSDARVQNEISGLKLLNKSDNDEVERIGIASHVSDKGREYGINPGDVILFGKNCEYDIVIENKKYYRMHMADIITILGGDVKISTIKQ